MQCNESLQGDVRGSFNSAEWRCGAKRCRISKKENELLSLGYAAVRVRKTFQPSFPAWATGGAGDTEINRGTGEAAKQKLILSKADKCFKSPNAHCCGKYCEKVCIAAVIECEIAG